MGNIEDSIHLTEYDGQWPGMGKLEILNLRLFLPASHIIDIQHVGSTAIPGMIAKPIIDIQVAVDSLDPIKETLIAALNKHEYVYWKDNPDHERLFFVKGMPPHGMGRTHHVHIVELSNRHWRDKILFRDYLIAHPEAAAQYSELKIALAQKHMNDREQYTDAKTQFIQRILKKAGNQRY
jgi:GrpB-like predicted nucleotidyltransferase (UPF0157 family)